MWMLTYSSKILAQILTCKCIEWSVLTVPKLNKIKYVFYFYPDVDDMETFDVYRRHGGQGVAFLNIAISSKFFEYALKRYTSTTIFSLLICEFISL
jgi:hypothetical protein